MYKTQWFKGTFSPKSFLQTITGVCLVVILAFTAAIIFFEFYHENTFNFHFVSGSPFQEQTPLKAAAARENITDKNPAAISAEQTPPVVMVLDTFRNNYAFRGDNATTLMKFRLVAPEDVLLKEIVLHMDQFSKAYDLKSLQLYRENTMLQETSFFEGMGIFRDLLIKIPKNKETLFQVKGNLSEQAHVGDRIRLLFVNREAIKITNMAGDSLTVKTDYPVKGDIISVIGKTLTQDAIAH